VEETWTDNEKLNQGFQEMASESEWDRHITESQLRQENNDLEKALVSLQEKNQRPLLPSHPFLLYLTHFFYRDCWTQVDSVLSILVM
jgi:hypothetical protein